MGRAQQARKSVPMAYVHDLWTRPNPDKTSKKKRIQGDRWGKGKRWQVTWVRGDRRTTKTFATRDSAELFASKVDATQDAGTWITKDKQDITLTDIWALWLPTKQGAVAASTLRATCPLGSALRSLLGTVDAATKSSELNSSHGYARRPPTATAMSSHCPGR